MAQAILAMAERRMWRLYTPLVALALGVSLATSHLPNGVSVLALFLAGGLVMLALLDWFGSEREASRAE